MKILLAGGGSGGPVSPLLAIAQEIKKEHLKAEFLLVGTSKGPESVMAKFAGIGFRSIPAAKLRRYFSWTNFLIPFQIIFGFLKSLAILRKFRPDCVVGAGSFVQVPVIWAAYFLRIPCLIHQQDVVPSLANSLCQYPAKKITVTFEDSLKHFYSGSGLFYSKNSGKMLWTGNPFRADLKGWTKKEALEHFHLNKDIPVLLVLGGGTGSDFLNRLTIQSLTELTRFVQVLHISGKGKTDSTKFTNYLQFSFLNDLGPAYAAADIVLCRAGLSTITELSFLGKLSIVVPMPESHQENNAHLLGRLKAAIAVSQNQLTQTLLIHLLKRLLYDREVREALEKNIKSIMPKTANKKIAGLVTDLSLKHYGK